ncbi:type II secretion system protein [Butyrivibrio sp. AE3004]|uniref:type II secretion system protein n=1 Tax=Butyrivibrio sp. AE3004 TaxID=1506994 RepID=UPI00068BD3DA|nr:prepilin-type N-terminal cleavage/methylation domain-containing protein [Butyrivibrio sp. AE3004]
MIGLTVKKNNKGLTVAELLIVVAIIAVLVAITIPIFTNLVERSREAYDIYTMRQAASAAIELYYSGVTDSASASAAGLSWSGIGGNAGNNAYGAYNPGNGKIYPSRQSLPAGVVAYGKGTKRDGGTKYVMGNSSGAYDPTQDYRDAVVMVSIYPNANPAYVDIYWKNNRNGTNYVGGQAQTNMPKYSIRVYIQ